MFCVLWMPLWKCRCRTGAPDEMIQHSCHETISSNYQLLSNWLHDQKDYKSEPSKLIWAKYRYGGNYATLWVPSTTLVACLGGIILDSGIQRGISREKYHYNYTSTSRERLEVEGGSAGFRKESLHLDRFRRTVRLRRRSQKSGLVWCGGCHWPVPDYKG